jgi:hypothetical protein
MAPDNQAELMRWHYHLGHFAFKKLQQLACNSKIPKRLANVRAPRCSGCLFGAMNKVPWRGKECKVEHRVFTATKPGECISINHLQLTEPCFFGQAKGALTKTHYKSTTINVNQYSRLKFVYLMTSNLTLSETINTKRAFKNFATMQGVRILHYHCNNGWFANNNFKLVCKHKAIRDSPSVGSMPTFKME